jgi:maltooligosyltrehalose trehalohydrolase
MLRRLPVGAEVQPDHATHFRVWAPRPRHIELVIERRVRPPLGVQLESEGDGYFSALVPGVGAGDRYRYRLDDRLFADPASRFQPDGPCGPSQIVDPTTYQWHDQAWRGATIRGQILYELHVGTFTQEGTWRAAMGRLTDLADCGVTAVEIMPVADFAGRFGWGYDGVFPYAPYRGYGSPDDFRAFVDHAHGVGLAVILDVVYNHFGPSGSVFREYSETYFTSAHDTDWGEALNVDGRESAPLREFFTANAAYWIREFHLDGLRLDAIHSIHDNSPDHIVAAVTRSARQAADGRTVIVVTENERQESHVMRPEAEGGFGTDASWNDDFHHSALVALTGRREAYYSDHYGRPREFIAAARHGFLFQGQRYSWQKDRRGSRTDGLPPWAFVVFIENHDQLANSGDGSRVHQRSSPASCRALTALLLLFPSTPMLFQGQEFGASTPFLYFADHEGDLAAAVHKGRAEFVSQFPSMKSPQAQGLIPAPHDPATFERCKLRWEERSTHAAVLQLHKDLLSLRTTDVAFRRQEPGAVDGAVIGEETFVLRYATADPADERLLVVNLGVDLVAAAFPEPLIAPPDGFDWRVRWSSEDAEYGGGGTHEIVTRSGWRVPGRSATVLAPLESDDGRTRRH